MSKENYTNVRNAMHVYSRSPLAEGQLYVDQATARSGHRISIDEIRADTLPKIASIEERNSRYLADDNGKRIVGGQLGRNYTNVIKFIDKAVIREIPNSNGEAYIVVNDNNEPYVDWVDPSDVPINQHTLSEGFTIRLLSQDGTQEIQRNYGWDFDAFNGILHFSSAFKPGMSEWEAKGFGKPVIEGFVYIGKHVSDITSNLNNSFNESRQIIDDAIAQCLSIQPFKFTSDLMQKIGDPYQVPHTGKSFESRDWFQTVSFIVPGYCFELTSLDRDETIITEMRHLSTGDTQIFIDLPWDMNYQKPIIKYAYDSGIDGQGNKFPVIGTYSFIATTFVSADGRKITVKPTIDFSLTPSLVTTIPTDYVYTDEDQQGMISPYLAGTYVGTYPGHLTVNLDSDI